MSLVRVGALALAGVGGCVSWHRLVLGDEIAIALVDGGHGDDWIGIPASFVAKVAIKERRVGTLAAAPAFAAAQ
jgi:hypothetical protein